MTIMCDIKTDVIMCEPHCVKIIFVNLLSSQAVWIFDTWHIHVSHLVVMYLVNLVNIFTEYVNIYLRMLGVNSLYILFPENSSTRINQFSQFFWK